MGDFFDKDKDPEAPTTIKVGEKEYSQDELSQLVGLGETAREYETKWNRKVSEFYPDYTQKSQRLAELERVEAERARVADEQLKKEAEEKQKELDERARLGKLSPEEMRQQTLKEAREIGIVTKEEFGQEVNKAVLNVLGARQLVDDTSAVIAGAEEKGQPKTTVDDLLKFMEENGIKKPEVAYKLMFEEELDKWKEETLKGIKPTGFQTQTTSTAGGKQPPPPQPITRDNLAQAIRESLTRSRGV